MNCAMEPGTALEWILQSLTGCARREVLQRSPERLTADGILRALTDTFGDTRSPTALLSAFHQKRQGAAESLLCFAHHLQRLAQQSNDKRPGNVTEETLRDQFVEGLLNPALRRDVRRYVREHPSTDFIGARAEAQRWLKEDDLPDYTATVQQSSASQPTNELAEVKKELARLTERMASIQLAQSRSTTPVTCFYCQRSGHRQDVCRKKQRDAQQRARTSTQNQQQHQRQPAHQQQQWQQGNF